MPTGLRSPTTTSRRGPPRGEARRSRLPRNRPPTHPGEMLLEEFLRPLGMKQTEFAKRIGVSFPRLNEVIHAKRALSPDTALRLERVLGMPADFWLGLQLDWDLWHAARGPAAAAIGRLEPVERKG